MRRAPALACLAALLGSGMGSGPSDAAGLRGSGGGAGLSGWGGRGIAPVGRPVHRGLGPSGVGHRFHHHPRLGRSFAWGAWAYPGPGYGPDPVDLRPGSYGPGGQGTPGVVAALGIRATPVSPPLVYVLHAQGGSAPRARHPRWRGPKAVGRTGAAEYRGEEPPFADGSGARIIHLRVRRGG